MTFKIVVTILLSLIAWKIVAQSSPLMTIQAQPYNGNQCRAVLGQTIYCFAQDGLFISVKGAAFRKVSTF